MLALASVFPVVYSDKAFRNYQGSSFLLFDTDRGQMVYATAKHILEPLYEGWTKEGYVLVPHLEGDKPSRTHVAAIRIDGVFVAATNSDVGLIRCGRRPHGDLRLAYSATTLKIAPAVIGEMSLALGFAHHSITEEFNFTRDVRVSSGIIEEVFDTGRGTNPLYNFPTFQVDATYDPGMSGGPVLDELGKCIGIVSRGVTTEEGIKQVGIATPIACIGELRVELEMDDGSPKEFKVPELAGKLIKLSDDGPAVTIVHDDNGIHLVWPANADDEDRAH